MAHAHDLDPWRRCYRELAPKLLLFARQWVPSQGDAEDVVQTAFVRFWKKHPDANHEHYPLLYAAVRTIALDHIRGDDRRVRRENHPDAPMPRDDAPCFDLACDDPEDAELAASIDTALRQLPDEQREVVVLKIWAGLTFQQIADMLSAPINTVAARYRYALDKLRNRMTSHERV
jgi:RNA polymerase sigma-70 factor (ECF subfamily)